MSRALYGIGAASNGYDLPKVTVNGVANALVPSTKPANEAFSIFWPRTRPNAGAKGVIFLIGGAGHAAKVAGSGGGYEGIQNYLSALGYIVVAADFGSNGSVAGGQTNPDTWGNNVAMLALDEAFRWACGALWGGTSTSTTASTMVDTGQVANGRGGWSTNQWTGHTITCGSSTGVVAFNDGQTLTLTAAGWTGGTPSGTSAYTISGHYDDVVPFAKTNKVILVGVSMGGWIVRNWASRNTAKVACIVDIAGVVDGAFQYGVGSGSGMDYAFGPAVPPSAPSTPTGTAGATSYSYKTCEVSPIGDGPPTTNTAAASLAAQGVLGTTPNTLAGITHPAFNSSGQPVVGTKILRSIAGTGGPFNFTEIVGQTRLSATTGIAATTTLTCDPLPYFIPNGSTIQLSHPTVAEGYTGSGQATTQNVVLSAQANAGATTITVTSFTPASGDATVAWLAGTKVKVVTYIDRFTGVGSAYTAVSANGASSTTAAYGVNGKSVNPSYDPQDATNLTAGLKALPLQMWWSANDGGTSTASGVPGTVNTEVQTYKNSYGANATLQEIAGDPVHANTATTLGASAANLATLGAFVNANAP